MLRSIIKYIVTVLCLLFLWPAQAIAQTTNDPVIREKKAPALSMQPVVIEDISKLRMPAVHYETQRMLWEQKVKQEPANAEAWLNYYKATRFIEQAKGNRIISKSKQAELDNIIAGMEKNIPGTFEYHYVKYINGNYDLSLFHHLEKAYDLQPRRAELYKEFILYYELENDDPLKREFCRKWYDSKDIAPSVYEYNRNVLASLQPHAVLYTNGDYDTYPLWILQEVEELRKDVTIINVNLLSRNPGTNKLFRNEGIVIPSAAVNGESKGNYFAGISLLNPGRPFYFALSLSQEYLKPIKKDLYLTGLAFRYSSSSYDNITELKNNFSGKISLAYLDKPDTYDKQYVFNRETVHGLHLNYVMPLLILYDAWKAEGNNDKAGEAMKLARRLAQQGGKEELLNTYLQKKQ